MLLVTIHSVNIELPGMGGRRKDGCLWVCLFGFGAFTLWDFSSGAGVKPGPLAMRVGSPNHCTTGELPPWFLYSVTL